MRTFTDVNIPGALLPSGILRATEKVPRPDGSEMVLEWVWPSALTPRSPGAGFRGLFWKVFLLSLSLSLSSRSKGGLEERTWSL